MIDKERFPALYCFFGYSQGGDEAYHGMSAKHGQPWQLYTQWEQKQLARAELRQLKREWQAEAIEWVQDEVRALTNLPDKMNDEQAELCVIIVGIAAATIKGAKLREGRDDDQ